MIKISFLGDIMCEGPLLNACKMGNGLYCFDKIFDGIKGSLETSDYIVGNLETPLAGKSAGYTKGKDLYSFNTPDIFAKSLRDLGINLCLTANNHCCDRKIAGLERTNDVLDMYGLSHTGTYREGYEEIAFRTQIKGIKLSVLSCTQSTNSTLTGLVPGLGNVNLLDEQYTLRSADITIGTKIKLVMANSLIGQSRYIALKEILGRERNKPYIDNELIKDRADFYIDRIATQIKEEKNQSDFVIVCPHMGGQFNEEPGVFSKYVMEKLTEAGADAVIASHPHIIQRACKINGKPCFYSLGNVSMSTSTVYTIRDNLPDHGIIAHLYLDKSAINKITFSIIKMTEDKRRFLKVENLKNVYDHEDDCYKKQIRKDFEHIKRLMNVSSELQLDMEMPLFN